MENKKLLTNQSEIEEFELKIIEAQRDTIAIKLKEAQIKNAKLKEGRLRICAAASKRTGRQMTMVDVGRLPALIRAEIFDEVCANPDDLIKPSHYISQAYKYSLLTQNPELKKHIPNQNATPLEMLLKSCAVKASETMRTYSAKNTMLAHHKDLVYWQAWLSAIGFDFNKPITEKEIIAFIIQHAEGLDPMIDKKLVGQGYKHQIGKHKLSTIKRRIGSLSVFLDLAKWNNPCRNKTTRLLLQKLTKVHGSSKPAGKAITLDILNDMLSTCKEKPIDMRDKALLLFAWSSGGRRRSEVADAKRENLNTTPLGEYLYKIPKSKTDQEGVGYTVPIKGRAARALTAWLSISNAAAGPIFHSLRIGKKEDATNRCLSHVDIYRIVQNRLKKAGYENFKDFGAHSLRSGFVTEAGMQQKPLGDVMALTTHKNVGTVMRYYQAGNVINNSCGNLADE